MSSMYNDVSLQEIDVIYVHLFTKMLPHFWQCRFVV